MDNQRLQSLRPPIRREDEDVNSQEEISVSLMLEKSLAQLEDERSYTACRWIDWLCLICHAVYPIADMFIVSGSILPILSVRFVSIIMFACHLLRLRWRKRATKRDSLITSYLAGLSVVGVSLATGQPSSDYILVLSLAMMCTAVMLPISPAAFLSLGLVWPLTYGAMAHFLNLIASPGRIAVHMSFLVMAFFTSYVVKRTGDRLRSRNFLQTQQIRLSSIKLETANRDLSTAAIKLKERDEAKNVFFANVSHELRTPLMLVLASLEGLREEMKGAENYVQQFDVIRRNGVRLLKLVDDLLELSRLESETVRLKLSRFELGKFVDDLLTQTRPLAERKNISLRCEVRQPAELVADEGSIERVVLNLLTNALKFTPAGGAIVVAVEQDADFCRIILTDTGPGIPAAELGHVFERFYQGEGGKKTVKGGVGIGLSMCKKIVDLHGGKIVVTSPPGSGAAFAVTLPVCQPDFVGDAAPQWVGSIDRGVGMPEWDQKLRSDAEYRFIGIKEATERRVVARPESSQGQAKVLVVDDNRDMVEFIAGILAAEYDVYVASDGESGLAMAQRHRPDMVISDVSMPKMDGFAMLAAIRADANLHDTPVIMMTARGIASDQQQSDEYAADAFLPKPFYGQQLRPIVKRLLSRQTSHVRQVADAGDLALQVVAGGIAHDILNPVGFVRSGLTFMQMAHDELRALVLATGTPTPVAAPSSPTQADPLSEIAEQWGVGIESAQMGVQRVIEAVEQLRDFSRGTASEPVATDVNHVVSRTLAVTKATAQLTTRLQASCRVGLRRGQLERVMLNLVLNAIQAGDDKTAITVTTADAVDRDIVIIQVIDTGPGMDTATMGKLFQPYFTTKKTGTGLGLAMCRQIVHDHGGQLAVDSQPQVGTTFTIELPVFRPIDKQSEL